MKKHAGNWDWYGFVLSFYVFVIVLRFVIFLLTDYAHLSLFPYSIVYICCRSQSSWWKVLDVVIFVFTRVHASWWFSQASSSSIKAIPCAYLASFLLKATFLRSTAPLCHHDDILSAMILVIFFQGCSL